MIVFIKYILAIFGFLFLSAIFTKLIAKCIYQEKESHIIRVFKITREMHQQEKEMNHADNGRKKGSIKQKAKSSC
jgi:hypothetical protein